MAVSDLWLHNNVWINGRLKFIYTIFYHKKGGGICSKLFSDQITRYFLHSYSFQQVKFICGFENLWKKFGLV